MLGLDCLPDELLFEILSRLPIKTLIICACTCKWLFSLIATSSFMVAQMMKCGNNNHPFLFLKYHSVSTKKDYFSLHPDDDSFTGDFEINRVPISCDSGLNWSTVVGSCNGVVCLCSDFSIVDCDIYLWNPCIRRLFTVPKAEISWDGEMYGDVSDGVKMGLGFGFDLRANDFKVVRLVYGRCAVTRMFKDSPIVQVYSLKLNSWKVVESFGSEYQLCKHGYSQCYVNGAVHWPGWSESDGVVIVSFNVEDERFRVMKMPRSWYDGDEDSSIVLRVVKFNDKLALIKLTPGSIVICSVSIMREYGVAESWSELFFSGFPEECQPRLFAFRKNEQVFAFVSEKIYRNCDGRHLMLLISRNGIVNKVMTMIEGTTRSFFLDSYVESLALLKEGQAVSHNIFQACNGSESGEA